ncbi:trehalase family glycosidase [Paenibacillus oryzisoli]|uniref:MGH1-like glycoside hydrolase domain-containing protein n=1 Tax=Paenibacillus oryzisoli TaxID=1850517 RepID=UPI003D275BE7
MLEQLKRHAASIGKEAWRPMLVYTAELHERNMHPASAPFPYPWEEIGIGYFASPAFGHWDLIHQVMDSLPCEPLHARHQLLNNLALQGADGHVPGTIWLWNNQVKWSTVTGNPPVWPIAVQEHYELHGDLSLPEACYEPLLRQLGWFERKRKAEGEGYFYTDILTHSWESGIDDGVRYDAVQTGAFACIDATCHVYQMYEHAAKWAELLGHEADKARFAARAEQLGAYIRERLYAEDAGFFYDSWSVNNPALRRTTMDGMWPIVVGAATKEQANSVIDRYLLNPERFFTAHPIPAVSLDDPGFELRMWRGPTWNSMTYWAARGCVRYGRTDAALKLLEKALDATAEQFERTETVWEFYHPHLGEQTALARKPYTDVNEPCRDYLGHNPAIALARLWTQLQASGEVFQ